MSWALACRFAGARSRSPGEAGWSDPADERAVPAWNEQTAARGREHVDANVIGIGARMHTREEATKFVEILLKTLYSGDDRHARSIAMLDRYGTTGELPELH
ncbi:hypothetical protein EAO69_00190 [Streptomyces sp. me109]|nr:hypothetical protein EAO69_00190 [Streptomyces sp. me109]